jgi:sulfhydrogenase subunit delta
VDIVFFPLAQDDNKLKDLDILFVEGSVSSEHDESLLVKGREVSKVLVAIGSCACYGGVQAQENDRASLDEMLMAVYGTTKMPFKVMKAKPLSDVVKVDYELPGCPVDRKQFVYALTFLLNGVKPFFPKVPVCHECKLNENECLLLKGIPCLGPITQAGCGAPCPAKGIGCVGCRGNCDAPNFPEMIGTLEKMGLKLKDAEDLIRIFRGKQAFEGLSKGGDE